MNSLPFLLNSFYFSVLAYCVSNPLIYAHYSNLHVPSEQSDPRNVSRNDPTYKNQLARDGTGVEGDDGIITENGILFIGNKIMGRRGE
jgi:hypothetical protein